MPIDLRSNQNVICWHFEGRWSWRDFESAWAQTLALMDTTDQPLHVFYEIGSMVFYPTDVIAYLRSARVFGKPKHPCSGEHIVIGADQYIERLWHLGVQFLPQSFETHFVSTRADAYRLIESAHHTAC